MSCSRVAKETSSWAAEGEGRGMSGSAACSGAVPRNQGPRCWNAHVQRKHAHIMPFSSRSLPVAYLC